MTPEAQLRKIIHIDMDCFYAAIEMREHPALATQPLAVGGAAINRGVLCTCNYLARSFGLHSAMPTAEALRRCPGLVVLPVNMALYRAVATRIQAIFKEFTPLVEPLSLDEAYLDVTEIAIVPGAATACALAIRERIFQSEQLTASAGISVNKFLAKIASGLRKPNGIFVIKPHQVEAFLFTLPIEKLHGVGKKTADKLHRLGIVTCGDLRRLSALELSQHFGKFGKLLFNQCRGEDQRAVEPNQIRKSISVEQTFTQDFQLLAESEAAIELIFQRLQKRIADTAANRIIKSQFIKLKFSDFSLTTAESISPILNRGLFDSLLRETYSKKSKPIRLIGLGVSLKTNPDSEIMVQQTLALPLDEEQTIKN